MHVLLLVIAAGLGWAWWTGRLKGLTIEDGFAIAALLLGLRLAATGKPIIGLPLIAGAVAWGLYRQRAKGPQMAVDDARKLLGVNDDATLADIRAAHRRLIARVHPDGGGSAELANRVNVARDTLVSELTRRDRLSS